jgi:hypothetical protein
MYSTSHYHVFALPRDLLDTLTARHVVGEAPARIGAAEQTVQTSTSSVNGARSCNICLGASFADVDEQRSHFRSDWHRYNVKTRLNSGRPVTESDFDHLVQGTSHPSHKPDYESLYLPALEDSISGSASTSDESTSGDSDAVVTLMNKTKMVAPSTSPESTARSFPQTPIVWFHSPPSTQIGVYKSVFPTATEPAFYLDELKKMQQGGDEGRMWAMFMVAGGHFAGAIIRVGRPDEEIKIQEDTKGKKKPQRPKTDTEVLKHKTFHRYTSSCFPSQ